MTKKHQQALHYYKKPPKKVEALIELVNCLGSKRMGNQATFPSDIRNNIWVKYPERWRKGRSYDEQKADHLFVQNAMEKEVLKAISALPKVLQDFVQIGFWCDGESSDELTSYMEGGAFGRYEEVWSAKINLILIANNNRDLDKESKDIFLLPRREDEIDSILVRVDEKGILRRFNPLFLRVIETEEVEAARIRECPICDRFFWAGRITQKCCTSQCANTFRVHRHRYRSKEEKADYELRRARREKKRKQETQGAVASPNKKGR